MSYERYDIYHIDIGLAFLYTVIIQTVRHMLPGFPGCSRLEGKVRSVVGGY
jgi:hypothetical protein